MDLSRYTQFLSSFAVFNDLTDSEMAEIAKLLKMGQRKAGQVLCIEGQPGECMFILESGCVEVSQQTEQGDQQVLATIQAPTVIGELALLDGAKRSATVTAVQNVNLYRLDGRDFNSLRDIWSTAAYKVIYNLASTLCARLRDTNQKIDEFFSDPEAALASLHKRQQQLSQPQAPASD